jgi:hypothetical protein
MRVARGIKGQKMAQLTKLIIDDFYPDPQAVRRFALSLGYMDAATARDQRYYRGAQSTTVHPYSRTGMDLISEVLRRVTYWNAPHGDFRLLRQRDPGDPRERPWVHYDSVHTRYAAIVFLNLPEQCQGGTVFYRHKEFGCDRMPERGSDVSREILSKAGITWDQLIEKIAHDGFDVEARWEEVGAVKMRFNRCVIFDSRQFHAREGGFGETKETMRLTQNYFFDIDDPDNRATGAVNASRLLNSVGFAT